MGKNKWICHGWTQIFGGEWPRVDGIRGWVINKKSKIKMQIDNVKIKNRLIMLIGIIGNVFLFSSMHKLDESARC